MGKKYMYFSTEFGFREYATENSVELSYEYYNQLMTGQTQGGYIIVKDGIPCIKYDIIDYSVKIRERRNILLSKTDWTQMGDIPPHIKIPYAEYRQQLRNIPQQEGFPQNIVWPEEPNIKKAP